MTKNNPGKFDCYAKADPDEPMFVLLARDPAATTAIEAWIQARKEMGLDEQDSEKLREASDCAYKMEQWRRRRLRKGVMKKLKGNRGGMQDGYNRKTVLICKKIIQGYRKVDGKWKKVYEKTH